MIPEIDAALSGLLTRDVLGSSQVSVTLDPPTKEWAAHRSGPTMNVFLYDIREDMRRRGAGMQAAFDERGRPTSRRPLPRVFRFSYLITAWTQRPEDEHRLLSTALRTLLRYDVLPADLLPDGPPVSLTVGLPPGEDRSFADVWSALGGEMRASIDVVLSTAYETGVPEPVDTLVTGPIQVDTGFLGEDAVGNGHASVR
ncbi:DUF4255 domain-containing protein [Kribbella sp. NBC_01505]|uniref:DUF4255 domain-containing protein n=1 Tax=Kribbella sp. NBC_01505 TaxID=2903580 RepID=UPI0038668C20